MECDWLDLPCHLSSFSEWLLDVLLYVPEKVWELLLDGLAAVIEAIPAPTFLAALNARLGLLPSSAIYLADIFALQEGIILVIGALIARFILRRIPIIG